MGGLYGANYDDGAQTPTAPEEHIPCNCTAERFSQALPCPRCH